MIPGEIYRHDAFYVDPDTGESRRKYFVVLAALPSGDFVSRLLTSRPHGRPEEPPCFHGLPYPSFFLGVPGGELGTKTWVDLRSLDDVDPAAVQRSTNRNIVRLTMTLSNSILKPLLDCAARANDTTVRQEHALRDQLARLR